MSSLKREKLYEKGQYLVSKLSLCEERSRSEEQRPVGGKHRPGHTTFQRSEICGLRPKTAQRSWQQHRKSNTNGFHESKNWQSPAGNVLYINLNEIYAIELLSATLLVYI